MAHKYLIRPVNMLFTPICFLVSLYSAFVYGILYANLAGFSIVFEEVRGWGAVTGNVPFLALFVGILGAAGLNIYNNKYYFKRFKENGNRSVPEARLPPMMIGGILFAGGLFLFGCEHATPILLPIKHLHTTRRDVLPQPKLLAFDYRHRHDGVRLHVNIPSSAELPYRYLHAVCCQCGGCQHIPALRIGRRISPVRRCDVP